jgi:hypothetical protein
MAILKNTRNAFSAISTGVICGAIAYITLGYFFPPEPPQSISFIASVGGLTGLAIGVYTGWRWAQILAESLIVELLLKVIFTTIASVTRLF